MPKNLVIVESPAKAKTIEKYLGTDFKVKSSFGHIRDLPSKGMNVDIENNFEPEYAISKDKQKVVTDLKKAAKGVDTVWLATDEDREGEAIAWHLMEAMKLKDSNTKRIVFHEITEPAIKSAVADPRKVDQKLVDAQQARRILDRLVGYELSPVLWKKVRKGLSAGRVQSVAVRFIVEREREIEKFEHSHTYKVVGDFANSSDELTAEMPKKVESKDKAKKLLENLNGADFTIESVESKPGKKSSSPPFTTSTLQQAASQRLGYSVKQTMVLAQRLYESGKITYMRTDSLNLSEVAIKAATAQISRKYGPEYSDPTRYKTKSSGAQEAHEAIRPTNFSVDDAGADPKQQKLYRLIWQRAIASQMSSAKIDRTTLTIKPSTIDEKFVAKAEVVTFPGFLAAYPTTKKDGQQLPELKEGTKLDMKQIVAKQTFARPPARFTEASLVKQLEEDGIGRPSTYAPTISTIQDRGYIEKKDLEGTDRDVNVLTLKNSKVTEEAKVEKTGADKNKLIPTELAGVVTDFLTKHFDKIVDYDFTAKVEAQFDRIADGDETWREMIADFYGPFHKKVEAAESISRKDASGMRKLGKDPKSGKPIFARIGRYGPMLQIGEAEDDEKPTFAPMPPDAKLDSVTLEQAMPMFALPKTIGKTDDGQEIISNIGPYGPYIKIGKQYISIKPETPFTITLAQAKDFIKNNKSKTAAPIQEWKEEKIKIVDGRYGPYVTDGKKNGRISKDQDPKKLTLEDAQEILKSAKPRRKR